MIMGFGQISSLFDYNVRVYKLISSLIRRKFQRFQNFSFEIISLCLGKHIGRSLTEFATLYSFKLALNLYIITLNCRGKAEFVRNHE